MPYPCRRTKQTMSDSPHELIPLIHSLLHKHFGPLRWWPAETPYEVAVGAILTQNTAWTNVEYALDNLKQAQALSPAKIATLPLATLEEMIRPSGFFRQKAVRLQGFSKLLTEQWRGDITKLCQGPLHNARTRLLALHGIGPETADSILLYAGQRPSFVVDAYTRRIFERIGILQGKEPYDDIRHLFMQNLAEDVQLYNEYHAQIVELAKTLCRKRQPLCSECPIRHLCGHAKNTALPDNVFLAE